MKAILVDDECDSIKTLRNDLAMFCPEVEVIATCQSAKEGLLAIRRQQPDLLFLDIEMPWMNGFEMLEALGREPGFQVIFVTAYSQFAIQALRVSAVDYLLKPVDGEELVKAVAKAGKTAKEAAQPNLRNMLYNATADSHKKRIAIPNKEGYEFIPVENIIYCKASGPYTEIILEDQPRQLLSRSLGEVESLLPPDMFERIHHSIVVNLTSVSRYKKTNGSYIIMKNGDELTISKSKKEQLLIRLGLR